MSLAIEAATAVGGVAVAGFVEDSDFAFLLAATTEGALVWLLIDRESAEDYERC